MLSLLLIWWGITGLSGLFERKWRFESYYDKIIRLKLKEFKNLTMQNSNNTGITVSYHASGLCSTREAGNAPLDVWYPSGPKFQK